MAFSDKGFNLNDRLQNISNIFFGLVLHYCAYSCLIQQNLVKLYAGSQVWILQCRLRN